MRFGIRYAAGSDTGRLREANRDSGYAGSRLLAVADGGGTADGGIAGAEAIEILSRLDLDEVPADHLLEALEHSVGAANDKLYHLIRENPRLRGISTTVTAMLWSGNKAALVHIGSSRGYLLRNGELFQITHDHTLVQSLVDEGRISLDEAAVHPQRSLLLRVLDGRSEVEPDLSLRESRIGDRYLLCSNGLSDVVSAETIYHVLSAPQPPEDASRQLIGLANRGGGPDNITCLVADVVDLDQERYVQNDRILVGAVAEVREQETVQRRQEPPAPPAPPAEEVEPAGFTIPGFDIMEPLGKGGFATVYRGVQRSLNRPVALKVMHERLRGDGLRRFEREVDANLRLAGHPNVLTVHDRGELPDGRPYLVLEYCPGGSLADRLKKGALPMREVLRIGVKAADALAAAHREGILHRDIKPDNLLVTRYEPVALADFGIAKVLDPDGGISMTVKALTPAYAPPELFDEDYTGPTAAGDLYSLGATLYALLSGAPPRHPARPLTSYYALMAHHIQARDLPIPDIPGIPLSFMSALRGTLHRRPAARYRTADDFLTALQRVRLY